MKGKRYMKQFMKETFGFAAIICVPGIVGLVLTKVLEVLA